MRYSTVPFVNGTIDAAVMGVPTVTGPLTPATPGWICAPWILVSPGNPCNWKYTSAVDPVTVICTAPRPLDSALPTGGTSLAGLRIPVKTIGAAEGDVVASSSPHPTRKAHAATAINARRIIFPPA